MLFLSLRSKFIGSDEFGNRYYEYKKSRRFVIYKDAKDDPSTISVDWYLWLHYAEDDLSTPSRYKWQKPRISEDVCSVMPDMKNTVYYSTWEPNDKNK